MLTSNLDNEFIVFGPVGKKLPWRFLVVQVTMEVC